MFTKTLIKSMVDKDIQFSHLCSKLNISEKDFLNKVLCPDMFTIYEANILMEVLNLKAEIFFYTKS